MIYCENMVNVKLFFLLSPDLGTTFFSPFLAMSLPQLLQIFFPISAMTLPQLVCHNFFFSFHFGHSTHTAHPGSRIGQRNFRIHITEIQHFLSPPFPSPLSYFLLNSAMVYRNSLSFLTILNNSQQFL